MKQNLPVTSRQTDVPPGVTLVSKTDLKGRITYVNEAFVQISGYTLDELLHRNHHIVRHPDMPSAAFADMWGTLKRGQPWRGIIKNRCKDGGYYWVDACVVPVKRNDQVIGYMSVRKHATPAAIATAQALYRDMAAGSAKQPLGLPAWLGIRSGMRMGTLFVAALMLAGGALGIGGLKLADNALSRLYYTQLEPVATIGQIETHLSASHSTMLEIRLARLESNEDSLLDSQVAKLRVQRDAIHALLGQLGHLAHNDLAAEPLQRLSNALTHYTDDGLQRVEQAAAHDDPGQIDELLQLRVLPLEQATAAAAATLRSTLIEAARSEYEETLARNARIRNFAIAGILLGLMAVVLVGHMFIRGIVEPLNASIRRLNRIAQGDLQGEIDLSGTGESGQLNHAAAVMQLHLKVMIDEIALAARRIHQHCATLNTALYEVTEHSEEQHDRVYSAIRSLDEAVAETSDLSERAERLLKLSGELASTGVGQTLSDETRELATATRLAAFGAEEVAGAMRQVAELIVENRGEAQRAWQASEKLKHTAVELNNLVNYFEPEPPEHAAKAT